MSKTFNKSANGQAAPSDVTIFLDLDGVIADFDTHLHARGKADEKGSPRWDELDHEWWTSMPLFEGAKGFYNSLTKMAPVAFLSAPVPIVDSFSGKAEWIANKFFQMPQGRFKLLDLILCAGKKKQFLAGAGRILVDDRIKNISEWEEAGGIGVHHAGDYAATLDKVRQAIGLYRQQKAVPVSGPQP